MITFTFNILNNTTFTDIYSCYLLYRRDLVDPATLVTEGWEQQAQEWDAQQEIRDTERRAHIAHDVAGD